MKLLVSLVEGLSRGLGGVASVQFEKRLARWRLSARGRKVPAADGSMQLCARLPMIFHASFAGLAESSGEDVEGFDISSMSIFGAARFILSLTPCRVSRSMF